MTGNTTYQCLNCRLAQRAEVRTSSAPSTTARARGAHRTDANTSVAMLLALKRCPRCGYYDRGVASANRQTVRVALIASGTALALAVLCLFAIPAVSRLVFAVTAGLLGLGFLVLTRHVLRKFPQSVESRVILVGQQPGNDVWF
jgi:hypothetical protein